MDPNDSEDRWLWSPDFPTVKESRKGKKCQEFLTFYDYFGKMAFMLNSIGFCLHFSDSLGQTCDLEPKTSNTNVLIYKCLQNCIFIPLDLKSVCEEND